MFNGKNLLIASGITICAMTVLGLARHSGGGRSSLVSVGGNSGSDQNGTDQSGATQFELHKVMDTEGNNELACTFLLPTGWTSEDQVHWLVDNFTTPVVGSSVMKSGDGRQEIDSTSGVSTNFSHSPAGDTGVAPPSSLSEYLLEDWKSRHPGIDCQVSAQEDTPIDTSDQPGASMGKVSAQHGMVRLTFTQDGQSYQSKVQARMDTFQTNSETTAIGGDMYEGGWRVSSEYTVTAPETQFEDTMKKCAVVLTSIKTDPHFYSRVVQAQALIQQRFNDMENRIHETSQIISQTNDEISDSIMSSYNTAQAASDREAESFDDYIKGVDKYNDPSGPIDLPSGYSHAWGDGQGHYIVSDQGLYDPNVSGPGGSWQELEKTQ